MIRWTYNYLKGIPPVFLDGVLYVSIALFAFLQTSFGGDEAAKYISPKVLFYLKTVIGSFSASALSLKLYRSTSYSDHLKQVKDKENETKSPFNSTTSF